jgi:hypothetical protein
MSNFLLELHQWIVFHTEPLHPESLFAVLLGGTSLTQFIYLLLGPVPIVICSHLYWVLNSGKSEAAYGNCRHHWAFIYDESWSLWQGTLRRAWLTNICIWNFLELESFSHLFEDAGHVNTDAHVADNDNAYNNHSVPQRHGGTLSEGLVLRLNTTIMMMQKFLREDPSNQQYTACSALATK